MDSLVNISRQYNSLSLDIDFCEYLKEQPLKSTLNIIRELKSQIQQDLFVLIAHNFKENGYFIDFGATDGVLNNNSWILENRFGWNGIVAEPSKQWHDELSKNRKCYISTKCVWKESGESILFNETNDAGFSTINTYSDSDHHEESRKNGNLYSVETISLNDLLISANAPQKIDYLSIDTEGSEYEILNAFDFKKWDISVITVEHNFTDKRNMIKILLESKGFNRVLSSISQFDDWYIKPELMNNLQNSFLLEIENIS